MGDQYRPTTALLHALPRAGWAPLIFGLIALSLSCTSPSSQDAESADGARVRGAILAMRGTRPFLPRLPGLTAWSPCHPPGKVLRCASAEDPWPSLRQARDLIRIVGREDDPAFAAQARGLIALLSTDASQIDTAVQELSEAASLAPSAAGAADLGAAYLLRAVEREQPGDLARALEATEDALRWDETLAPALFNRALILERLFLWRAANDAWLRLVALNPEGDWALEASERRRRLAGFLEAPSREGRIRELLRAVEDGPGSLVRFVADDPQTARLFVERDLFATWAKSREASDDGAAQRTLKLIHSIAESQALRSGDPLDLDSWRMVESADPGSESFRALLRGHLDFAAGMDLYDQFDFVAARARLGSSARSLDAAGSPFAAWPAFYAAVCLYYVPDYPAVLDELAAIQIRVSPSYRNLLGRIAWIQGLVRLIIGEMDRSLAAYEEAVEHFSSTGEAQYVAYLHALIAKNLRYSGAGRSAWPHHLRALEGRSSLADMGRVFTILLSAAEQAEADGNLRTALYLMDEQVRAAESLDRPYVTAQAYLRRSRLLSSLGDFERARQDERRTAALLPEIPDGGNLQDAKADLLVTESHSRIHDQPDQVVPKLSEAQAYYRSVSDQIDLLSTFPLIARAHRRSGRPQAAVDQLLTAAALVDEVRSELLDPLQRAVFLESARSVFDGLIEIQAEVLKDDVAAVATVERSRNRVLLERLGQPVDGMPTFDEELRRFLDSSPDDHAALVYRVTSRRIFAWLLHSGQVRPLPVGYSPEEIRDLAADFRRQLEAGAPEKELRQLAGRLGRRLLPFPADLLKPGSVLTVVGDRQLAGIPFAALVHPETGDFLIRHWPVAVAPSVGTAIRVRPVHPNRQSTSYRALVVADPQFDPESFPKLDRLPNSRDEGRAIARQYEDASYLEGAAATRGAFLDQLPLHDIVHFGGHAIVDQATRDRRGLVFAASPGGGPPLFLADDIRGLDAGHLRLAVLAACETSSGYFANSEEQSSLSAAFLAAGAEAVVSSLWRIDDESASRVSTLFHWHFREQGDAIRALRTTQLELLESDTARWRSPATWAALEVTAATSASAEFGSGLR